MKNEHKERPPIHPVSLIYSHEPLLAHTQINDLIFEVRRENENLCIYMLTRGDKEDSSLFIYLFLLLGDVLVVVVMMG